MPVKVKRVYEPAAKSDGTRVLVDRLWPRGLTKDAARVDLWLKDLAPSDRLRKAFGHDPEKWEMFRRAYRKELSDGPAADALSEVRRLSRRGAVTLVFGARDETHCNAAVLRELLSR